MTCAKREVRCHIFTRKGQSYSGENHCFEPQQSCPRLPDEDYEKCKTICNQPGHAEEMALRQATAYGADLKDAIAIVSQKPTQQSYNRLRGFSTGLSATVRFFLWINATARGLL